MNAGHTIQVSVVLCYHGATVRGERLFRACLMQ